MNKKNFFLTLYAATTGVTIDLIGRLMLAEIIALLTLPFINLRQLLNQFKGLRIVLGSLSVLLLAQMISDFVNNSNSSDYLRGWALILFSMISTLYLVNQLSKKTNGIVYYLLAIFFIQLIFGQGDITLSHWEGNTNYFKARFVSFLNPAMMLLAYYLFTKNKQYTIVLLLFTYGLVCMALDARSNGLIYLISALLMFFKAAHIRLSGFKIFVWSLLALGIFYAGYIFYANEVLFNGLGGTNARSQLSKVTSIYNPFELIYYGRTDFFVLMQAIADKPLFGHGSWGVDPNNYYATLYMNMSGASSIIDEGFIRAHSLFLGTWAYAGIIGFLATLYMITKLFKFFLIIFKSNLQSNIFPILIILFSDMIWAYLFSPIGLLRTTFPIFAAIIITEYARLTNCPDTSIINKQSTR